MSNVYQMIRELRAKGGHSVRHIGRVVGMDPDSVRAEFVREDMGLPAGQKRQPNPFIQPSSPGWTTARLELLKKLWSDGLSASQIAGRLGGVTRNAVLSKVHRSGLSGRNTTERKRASTRRLVKAGQPTKQRRMVFGKPAHLSLVVTKPDPLPPPHETDVARVSFIDLDEVEVTVALPDGSSRKTKKHCRWICGDPREVKSHELMFCGDERVDGKPYCSVHTKRSANDLVVYRVPPQPRAAKIPTFADAEAD